jgi:hypothetical protein
LNADAATTTTLIGRSLPCSEGGARYSDNEADTMLFAWMGDDVEAILLVFAVTVAFVAIVVVLDLKLRGL